MRPRPVVAFGHSFVFFGWASLVVIAVDWLRRHR